MLQQAGVQAGAPVKIDFRGNDATFREVAQAAAGYLQALGLKPSLQPYEPPVLLNDIIPNGKTGEAWHNAWGGWTFDYDNTAYLMYHSGEKWNPYDNDPKLNAMLEKQRSIYDVKEREKLLQEIARYVADQAFEIPLYNQNTIYGVSKRLKNFEPPATAASASRKPQWTKASIAGTKETPAHPGLSSNRMSGIAASRITGWRASSSSDCCRLSSWCWP
jgi:peptide/nickel transport system substrate-binding protein